jgi:C-terminal processing protease CtpA/Prc
MQEIPEFDPIPPSQVQLKMPTVVLCSRYCISANETALHYVQSARIPIFGEITRGTNGDVALLHIFDSDKHIFAPFTAAKVTQLDGTKHLGVGIIPDKLVYRTQNGIRLGLDEQLEAALEHLHSN